MERIYYRCDTPQPGEYFGSTGTGYCSVIQECFTPVNLFEVNGTMTISDGRNIITIFFENNVAQIPILIDSSITKTVDMKLEEFENENDPIAVFNHALRQRLFRLSVGEVFRTEFATRNGEFNTMQSIRSTSNSVYPNVVEMGITFQIGGELQTVEPMAFMDLRRGGIFPGPFGDPAYNVNINN